MTAGRGTTHTHKVPRPRPGEPAVAAAAQGTSSCSSSSSRAATGGATTASAASDASSSCSKASDMRRAGSLGQEVSGSDLKGLALEQQAREVGGENRMAVLGGPREVNQELIEELLAGGGGSSEAQPAALEGFQRFSTQDAQRVVQVRATSLKKQESMTAVAGGLVWGRGAAGGGRAAGGKGGRLPRSMIY